MSSTTEFVHSDTGQVLDFNTMATILAHEIGPYDSAPERIMEYQTAQLWMMAATFPTYVANDLTTCTYSDDVVESYKAHRGVNV